MHCHYYNATETEGWIFSPSCTVSPWNAWIIQYTYYNFLLQITISECLNEGRHFTFLLSQLSAFSRLSTLDFFSENGGFVRSGTHWYWKRMAVQLPYLSRGQGSNLMVANIMLVHYYTFTSTLALDFELAEWTTNLNFLPLELLPINGTISPQHVHNLDYV